MKHLMGLMLSTLMVTGCGGSGGGGTNNGDAGNNVDGSDGPRILTGLTVTGPDVVAEGSQAQYTATASYDDGSHQDVTLWAVWSVEGPGTIGTDGR